MGEDMPKEQQIPPQTVILGETKFSNKYLYKYLHGAIFSIEGLYG
jgi:hypothetical protein